MTSKYEVAAVRAIGFRDKAPDKPNIEEIEVAPSPVVEFQNVLLKNVLRSEANS